MIQTWCCWGKLAVHDLWAHELQGAAHGDEDLALPHLQLLSQAEVDDPEVVVVHGVGKHDVEGLEVEVYDPLAVYELDPPHYLPHEYLTLPLIRQIQIELFWLEDFCC